MMSDGIMMFLIVVYAVIVAASAWEHNWPRAMYFVGAITISLAVLWMTTTIVGKECS